MQFRVTCLTPSMLIASILFTAWEIFISTLKVVIEPTLIQKFNCFGPEHDTSRDLSIANRSHNTSTTIIVIGNPERDVSCCWTWVHRYWCSHCGHSHCMLFDHVFVMSLNSSISRLCKANISWNLAQNKHLNLFLWSNVNEVLEWERSNLDEGCCRDTTNASKYITPL